MTKTILGVQAPKAEAKAAVALDKNCPFYGELNVKKASLVGTIIKKDAHGTATIEWERSRFKALNGILEKSAKDGNIGSKIDTTGMSVKEVAADIWARMKMAT